MKLQLPSTELVALLDSVLTKCSLSQQELAAKMGVGPHTISRWRHDGGIHKAHYEELQKLNADQQNGHQEPIIEKLGTGFQIPFEVTIKRSSLKFAIDKNGNINIRGILSAMIDKEDQ